MNVIQVPEQCSLAWALTEKTSLSYVCAVRFVFKKREEEEEESPVS